MRLPPHRAHREETLGRSASLISRSGALPRGLGVLGYVLGALLVVIYLGRLIVLEASNIPWRFLQQAYLLYMSVCMPVLGWLATGGDASAYRYLLHGIKGFPSAEQLAAEIEEFREFLENVNPEDFQ